MDPLQPLIETLNADGRPRVWSLVITVFGDSVQHRGGHISTKRLGLLLGRIGIGSGAVRTALSRLAADGWVEGQREGRSSTYSLTPEGRARFGPANALIFAPPPDDPTEMWVFDARPEAKGLRIAGGVLVPAPSKGSGAGFRMVGTPLPGSAEAVWDALGPRHRHALETLMQDLAVMTTARFEPLEATAARTLLIHRWRRIVLRWPEVPAEFTPARIAPASVRALVARAYAHLSLEAENWLDSAGTEMLAMPAAAKGFAQRFKSEQIP
jgi:phenylacetic acid degradation operon negative regulatory protein